VLELAEQNLLDSPQIKYIHFVGIGGISMSGLAEILLNQGYKISGSDIKTSNITERLSKLGIEIFSGHCEENIKNPHMVVYTAAVKQDNPELLRARELGIVTIERADLLGQIMKKYRYNINVSGTHGKTTTTSMITMIMTEAGLNPTVHIGGVLTAIGGNTRIGGNDYFVAEACEYVESFLKFHPYLAVILNIEEDHLDYFRDIEHIKESFLKYTSLIPKEGYVVACIDDANYGFHS
jgi:UDP-N-acetylmuramate--alanine ligase